MWQNKIQPGTVHCNTIQYNTMCKVKRYHVICFMSTLGYCIFNAT